MSSNASRVTRPTSSFSPRALLLRLAGRAFLALALALPGALPAQTADDDNSPSAANPSPFAIHNESEFFALMDLNRPGLEGVRTAVNGKDWAAAKQAWARHLTGRTEPKWIWSRNDRAAMQRMYAEKFDGLTRFTNAANRVLARDFDFLGVRKQLDHQVEWLQGPIEWTHVLSRFGYWQDLGLAWWATGRSAYAADFVYLLEDWVARNPVHVKPGTGRGPRGSVWRTLETGVRADSWFEAMELFMDAPEFDAEAKYIMTRSLVEHARYLEAWTKSYRPGNWQVCEASGLADVGIMLPEFRDAAAWRALGFDYLVQHMHRDVEPDGAHHELTPGYHSWVMQEFLRIAILSRKNGYEVPGLMDRHEKMFEFLLALTKPNRDFVPVGDAMAGHASGLRKSLGLGSLLYHRPDMRYLGSPDCVEEWIRLFGPGVCDDYAHLPSHPPAQTSQLLPDAKYAIMRTGWDKDANFLFFDCAPWRGGHSHRDSLQVVLSAGRDLLVDPGIFSYDQPLCGEYLRRTKAHNVVLIDGQEQPGSDPELLAWQTDADLDFVAGAIHEKSGPPLRHQRAVLFLKPDCWVMMDSLAGEGSHEAERLFHFPLETPVADTNGAIRTSFAQGMNLEIHPLEAARIEWREGWIPTGAATAEKAPVAAVVTEGKFPMTLGTILAPFARASVLPAVETLPAAATGQLHLRLKFPGGRTDEIVMAPQAGPLALGAHQATGWALCVRRDKSGERVLLATGKSE